MKPGHWALRGKQIVSAVRVSGGWSVIASVENERAVRQMLRYARLGEQIESVIDGKLGGALSDEQVSEKVEELTRACIHDIMKRENPIDCPEVSQEERE